MNNRFSSFTIGELNVMIASLNAGLTDSSAPFVRPLLKEIAEAYTDTVEEWRFKHFADTGAGDAE